MASLFKALNQIYAEGDFLEKVRLNLLLKAMKERGCLPANIEITPVAKGFFASVFDENESEIISESVSIGFSSSASLAALKGVVEFLERRAFAYGRSIGNRACQTDRSDGFAAFPTLLRMRHTSARRAQINAWTEAVERYCWSTWWDNSEIHHEILPHNDVIDKWASISDLLAVADDLVGLNDISAVIVEPIDSPILLMILLGENTQGGFITGGAAGHRHSSNLIERAAAEFYRHCLALKRMRDLGSCGESFYQKRLHCFGFGEGKELVKARLASKGTERIKLPSLAIDEAISYPYGDLVHVHRCLFQNQPPFIGGILERLCI